MIYFPQSDLKIVAIVWEDAVDETARHQIESVNELQLAINMSFGVVIHRNKTRVILVHEIGDTNEVDCIAIPTKNILKTIKIGDITMKEVNEKEKEKDEKKNPDRTNEGRTG